MKAVWNGEIIAQSKNVINIAGVTFFPEATVHREFLKTSDIKSYQTEFGRINFRDIEVKGSRLEGAAIHYTEVDDPMTEKVALINNNQNKIYYSSYIGFKNGVQIVK